MNPIHPKTSGAAVGVALGALIVTILGSIHGVHLTAADNAAIPSFLGIFVSWLVPATTPAPVAPKPPAPIPPAAPVA